MTKIVTLIGDLGGGKTSFAGFLAKVAHFQYPDVPIISNVKILHAQRVPDIHQFLAIKLMKQDKRYAFLIDDEAAQAGLESRGSGSKGQAIESRIVTLARKAHVDFILISQLKSMLDKRVQWLENNSILCEAGFERDNLSANPDYFHYTVYNSKLEEVNDFDIPAAYYREYIWPEMDTDDIPFKESLDRQFSAYYNIDERAVKRFEAVMNHEKPKEEMSHDDKEVIEWHSTKAFKLGEVILYEGREWDALNRVWDAAQRDYRYLLSERE